MSYHALTRQAGEVGPAASRGRAALDEADEMLTPNFREQIEGMFRMTRQDRQTLLFSATMPAEVQYARAPRPHRPVSAPVPDWSFFAACAANRAASRIAKTFMRSPIFMDLTTKTARTPSTVAHVAMAVRGNSDRATAVANLMQVHPNAQAMIFTNTRVRAAQLAEVLGDRGIAAVPMHSDLSQSLRELYLDRFRAGASSRHEKAPGHGWERHLLIR